MGKASASRTRYHVVWSWVLAEASLSFSEIYLGVVHCTAGRAADYWGACMFAWRKGAGRILPRTGCTMMNTDHITINAYLDMFNHSLGRLNSVIDLYLHLISWFLSVNPL
jgi:hypothetical protein